MSTRRPASILAGPLRRARLLAALRCAALVLAGLGGGAGLFVAGDAALALSRDLRAAAPWILLVLAVLLVAAGTWGVARLGAWRLARRAEGGGRETALSNAVVLARRRGGTPVAEHLRQEAVALGRRRARDLAVLPLVGRSLAATAAAATLVLAGWLLVALLGGEVLDAVLPRFFDVDGDHPPYSRVQLRLELGSRRVLYGGRCEVVARSTLPVEELTLVTVDAAGANETPMFRRPDRSFVQTLTNLRSGTEVWVTDGWTRSHRQRIAVHLTPEITAVEYVATFPAHTHLAERRRALTEGELAVPAGTALELTVASNRPLAGGALGLMPLLGGAEQTIPLHPVDEGGRSVRGGLTVTAAAAVELVVTDVDGLEAAESRKLRLALVPDRPPTVAVVEPDRDALATPEISVPVEVHARDDYGVALISWRRSLNDGPEHDGAMALPPGRDRRQVRVTTAFDFADLGVRPGDVVTYHFQAADNDPAGPQTATSREYRIRIISMEEYERILRQRMAQRSLFNAYDALNQHLRRLAENAEAARDAAADGARPEELAPDLAALLASLDEFRQTVRDMQRLPALFDLEKPFRAHLARRAEETAALRRALAAAAKAAAAGQAPPGLDEVARRLRELSGGTEREVGEPARLVTAVARLLAEADRFAALAAEQEHLARMLERFKGAEPLDRRQQMELKELAEGQRAVHAQLVGLRQRLPELVARVPADPAFDALRQTTRDFLQALDGTGATADQGTALARLEALDGAGAAAPARRAAERLLALCSRCQGMQGQGQQGLVAFRPSLSSSLGNTLAQLSNALQGSGSGDDGSGLAGNSVGLYGPAIELAGGSGGGSDGATATASAGTTTAGGQRPEQAVRETPPDDGRRIEPMTDVRFPLLYRQLVGDYYRRVAESGTER